MNEEVKRIFRRRFKALAERYKDRGGRSRILSCVMCELAELYAEINGMTFDEALAELHREDDQ